MDVVSGSAYRQCRYSILPCNPAKIRMEPFFDLVTDHRPPLRSSKHQMNKTTNVTVRHTFSRPFGTTQFRQVYPGFHPGLSSAVPSGLLIFRSPTQNSVPSQLNGSGQPAARTELRKTSNSPHPTAAYQRNDLLFYAVRP